MNTKERVKEKLARIDTEIETLQARGKSPKDGLFYRAKLTDADNARMDFLLATKATLQEVLQDMEKEVVEKMGVEELREMIEAEEILLDSDQTAHGAYKLELLKIEERLDMRRRHVAKLQDLLAFVS